MMDVVDVISLHCVQADVWYEIHWRCHSVILFSYIQSIIVWEYVLVFLWKKLYKVCE